MSAVEGTSLFYVGVVCGERCFRCSVRPTSRQATTAGGAMRQLLVKITANTAGLLCIQTGLYHREKKYTVM